MNQKIVLLCLLVVSGVAGASDVRPSPPGGGSDAPTNVNDGGGQGEIHDSTVVPGGGPR